jgi:hypothetical protein
MIWLGKQATTHIQEWRRDSSQYTPCMGKSDNTTYIWSLGPYVWQLFTTIIKELVRVPPPLVHVFHVIPLQVICGWPVHYPGIHHDKDGGVSSNTTTISATKFTEPHKFSMCQYRSMLAHQGPNDMVLNWHRWGLPLWSSELITRHSPPFPFGILYLLSPNFPSQSQFKMTFRSLKGIQL